MNAAGIIGYCCALNWYRGGSARISCVYEPQVGAP